MPDEAPQEIDARAIRRKAGPAGATQATFASALGLPVKTVRNWEQGRRQPSGPARVLLGVIDRNPGAVFGPEQLPPAKIVDSNTPGAVPRLTMKRIEWTLPPGR